LGYLNLSLISFYLIVYFDEHAKLLKITWYSCELFEKKCEQAQEKLLMKNQKS